MEEGTGWSPRQLQSGVSFDSCEPFDGTCSLGPFEGACSLGALEEVMFVR